MGYYCCYKVRFKEINPFLLLFCNIFLEEAVVQTIFKTYVLHFHLHFTHTQTQTSTQKLKITFNIRTIDAVHYII